MDAVKLKKENKPDQNYQHIFLTFKVHNSNKAFQGSKKSKMKF